MIMTVAERSIYARRDTGTMNMSFSVPVPVASKPGREGTWYLVRNVLVVIPVPCWILFLCVIIGLSFKFTCKHAEHDQNQPIQQS